MEVVPAIWPLFALQEGAAKAAASPQLFDPGRAGFLALLVFVSAAVLVPMWLARKGWRFYVRPIPGLSAIEEALGRCAEMGRPALFVPGVMDLNEIQTVAGITVLAKVAQVSASYDTVLDVPTSRTLVMAACREAVEGACLAAGRPESYNAELIQYITDDQFSYVAHVCGNMQRQRPAACFYLGQFFAESLLLAETGNAIGAIQISGTAESTQLPFFVAASDYTLIGEELFAASAYLSNDPQQLSTLLGQDLGKLLAVSLLGAGVFLKTVLGLVPESQWASSAFSFLTKTLLN